MIAYIHEPHKLPKDSADLYDPISHIQIGFAIVAVVSSFLVLIAAIGLFFPHVYEYLKSFLAVVLND